MTFMQFSPFMSVEPSATVAINSLALKQKALGKRIYNLSAGEPMVATHPLIMDAAKKAIDEGKTHYPPVSGIPELRHAATNWLNATYQTNYAAENCLITAGGKFGLYAFFQAAITPGDEVLMMAPYWVSYPAMVRLFGGVPKVVPSFPEQSWKVGPDDLEKNLSDKTKILVLNNGGNPTGILYTAKELHSLLAWAQEKKIMVISDEVYSGLTYDDHIFVSAASFPEFRNDLVVVQSCSKHFAMTGWRVGMVFAPLLIIEKLTMIQSQSTSGASSISQFAALAALNAATKIVPLVRQEMQARRDIFMRVFASSFHSLSSPFAGLYLFAALQDLGVPTNDSVSFCYQALDQAGVAIVPGKAFGQEGYVRFSFGAEAGELETGLRHLTSFIHSEYEKK